jgi:hypothetical protein
MRPSAYDANEKKHRNHEWYRCQAHIRTLDAGPRLPLPYRTVQFLEGKTDVSRSDRLD